MIYHSMNEDEEDKELIGVQKKNLSYTYLHWDGSFNKYRLQEFGMALSYYEYEPIGPTLLVEWGDE